MRNAARGGGVMDRDNMGRADDLLRVIGSGLISG